MKITKKAVKAFIDDALKTKCVVTEVHADVAEATIKLGTHANLLIARTYHDRLCLYLRKLGHRVGFTKHSADGVSVNFNNHNGSVDIGFAGNEVTITLYQF